MWSPWQRSKLYYYNNSNRRTTLLQCLVLAISKVSLEEMVGGAQVSLDNWTFTFLVGVYLYIFGRCRTVPTRIQHVFQYQIQIVFLWGSGWRWRGGPHSIPRTTQLCSKTFPLVKPSPQGFGLAQRLHLEWMDYPKMMNMCIYIYIVNTFIVFKMTNFLVSMFNFWGVYIYTCI